MTIDKAELATAIEDLVRLAENLDCGLVRVISRDQDAAPLWGIGVVVGVEETRGFLAAAEREPLRPTLEQAAQAVEAQLTANDYKGGWEDCNMSWMRVRLRQEFQELESAVENYQRDTSEENRERVGAEAADVMAMAMMVADLAGCYPHGERVNGRDIEGLDTVERLVAAGWDPEEAAKELAETPGRAEMEKGL